MKKIIKYISIIILICSVVIYLSYYGYKTIIVKPFVISSVSMGDDDSLSMINGIKYYLNKINKEGGIRGKPVFLKEYNDYGNPLIAKKIATEISRDNETLIVLGHYLSSCSQAAGRIYQTNGVPAITGSASSDDLTSENTYYFRLLPPNKFQSSFLAHYVKYILKKNSVSIVYEKSSYGTTFYQSFIESARKINLKINSITGISEDNYQDINSININDKTIVVGTHSPIGAKLLTNINYPGSNRTIIGSDSFSTSSFINKLKSIPQEKSVPGFFSDNLYTAMPFLKEFGSLETFNFIQNYKQIYYTEPNWVAFTYHDAAVAAVKAIELTELKNRSIRKIRSSIRNNLAGMYCFKQSVKGIIGSIFFDKNGNVINTIGIGYYKKGQLLPAYSQYQFIPNVEMSKNTFKQAMQGKIIYVDDVLLKNTSIVYTGVKLQKINNIDLYNSTYDIEFLIWFRQKGDMNVSDIVFEDALTPINLGKPVVQKYEDETTYTVFRVKGIFKSEFLLNKFPFDTHNIKVRYHHTYIPNYTLIYVPDKYEFSKFKLNESISYKNWKISDLKYFQDLHRFEVSPGKYVDYSQFNIECQIKRVSNGLIYRCIIPILFFFIISFLFVLIPGYKIGLRLILSISVLFIAILYYSSLSKLITISYYTILDFLYFILFCYQIISILLSILIFSMKNKKVFLIIEKIILPFVICLLVFLFFYFDSHLYFSKTSLSNDSLVSKSKNVNEKINSNEWGFVVNENAEINTFVGKLDIQNLNNQKITYDILGGDENKTFVIDSNTGEIHVNDNKKLDYELQNIFNLKIAIMSKSELTKVANVIIHVKDINEAPIFKSKSISINENIDESSVVLSSLEAYDPDNNSISYTIVSGNHDNTFKIKPYIGEISINKSPDYENCSSYTLVVKASDNLGLNSLQPVNVLINNINEKPIIKDQNFYYHYNKEMIGKNIDDNPKIFRIIDYDNIGKIIADDPDNSPLNYRIVDQKSIASCFFIDDSTLKIKEGFYYNLNTIDLLVEISDSQGLTSCAKMIIKIK